MKTHFIMVLFLFSQLKALAGAESKANQRDFILICEVSKMARSLKQQPGFEDQAERVLIHAKAIEALIQTDEVRNVVKAVSVASPDQKIPLLKKAAAETGLKNWKCPTLKFLY